MPVIVAKIREIAERVGGSEGIEIIDIQLIGSGRGADQAAA